MDDAKGPPTAGTRTTQDSAAVPGRPTSGSGCEGTIRAEGNSRRCPARQAAANEFLLPKAHFPGTPETLDFRKVASGYFALLMTAHLDGDFGNVRRCAQRTPWDRRSIRSSRCP